MNRLDTGLICMGLLAISESILKTSGIAPGVKHRDFENTLNDALMETEADETEGIDLVDLQDTLGIARKLLLRSNVRVANKLGKFEEILRKIGEYQEDES